MIPAGFHQHPVTGLILPDEDARPRQVWTHDEWRTLERATKLLTEKGLTFFLRCNATKECQRQPIERIRRKDGGITLRCAHLDREATKL